MSPLLATPGQDRLRAVLVRASRVRSDSPSVTTVLRHVHSRVLPRIHHRPGHLAQLNSNTSRSCTWRACACRSGPLGGTWAVAVGWSGEALLDGDATTSAQR